MPLFVSSQSNRFSDQSKGEDYTDENGIRTIVEYTVNEEGKKVKVRRWRSTSTFWPFL
jgi:Eukaryotic translation initiation factor 3 subunit G